MRNKGFISNLREKNSSIFTDLDKLKLLMPSKDLQGKLFNVSKKFFTLSQDWENFVNRIEVGVVKLKNKKKWALGRLNKLELGARRIRKREARVRSQEIVMGNCERYASKNLSKVKKMWRRSLDDMKVSMVEQSELGRRVKERCLESNNLLGEDFEKVFENVEKSKILFKKTENFPRKFSSNQGDCQRSVRKSKDFHEDLKWNNPVLYISEDIAPFRGNKRNSDMSDKKKKRKLKNIIAKNDKVNEILPESVSLQEVKQALFVLKKANLLEKSRNQTLLNLANMIQTPENSSNFELFLQLLNLESQKANNPKTKLIKKTSKPIKSPSFPEFSLDDSLTQSLISVKNSLSSSQFSHDQLTDVKLEDLLEIIPLIEDLGLLSADNTLIDELNQGLILTDD